MVPAIAALLAATSPQISKPASVEISAPGPGGSLVGTLVRGGQANAPIVLIIPGSGPTDRDGNSPLGVTAAPYRMLAEELASRGVTTLRADKRGMFGSATAVRDPNAVTIADYVADVRTWTAAARQATGASCVWLLGHSEGGLVALAAEQSQEHVCGLVLVATAGRPLGEVLKEQLRANPANAPLLAQAGAAIDALEKGQRVDVAAMPAPLLPLFKPEVQGFLISLFQLDPVEMIRKVRKPVLILQGERDIQVSVADAQALKSAAPAADLILLPETNHVLKAVASDDPRANLATYGDPDLPLAPGVSDAIAQFVRGAPQAH
jgi:hypothetical protein